MKNLTTSKKSGNTYGICVKITLLALLSLASCTEKQRLNILICKTAIQHKIPCSTAKELAHVESSYNVRAERFERKEFYRLSKLKPHLPPQAITDLTTSYGLFQVMGYHVKEPLKLLEPKYNIETALSHLAHLKTKCNSLKSAINAYNTGSCTKHRYAYLNRFKTLQGDG